MSKKNDLINLVNFLLLTVFSTFAYGQSGQVLDRKHRQSQFVNHSNGHVDLYHEIEILQDKVYFQQETIEKSINGVSIQLESASYNLTLFSSIFGILAVVLGIYVTYIERKIVKIGEENKELLTKNQKIKEDVEAVNKLIQSDTHNLFLKIKREETVHILNRLVKVPKDISNISQTLLSRELEQEDYNKLKNAYCSLNDKTNEYRIQYLLLFFQHFLDLSLKDFELRKDISVFIPEGIKASFENDIIKSTSDFITAVIDEGIQELKPEINLFFNGLTNSEYNTYEIIYNLLFDNLKSRKSQFEFFNAIESSDDKRKAKIEFGKLLQKKYLNKNLSISERMTFSELTELINAEQKVE